MNRLIAAGLLAVVVSACSGVGSVSSLAESARSAAAITHQPTPTVVPAQSEAARGLSELKEHVRAGDDEQYTTGIESADDPFELADAYAAYDGFIEDELVWLDEHLPAPCYEDLWQAVRRAVNAQHDLVIYLAARLQLDYPIGTTHIVSGFDREEIDELIEESQAAVASAVEEQGRHWDSQCP